MGSALSHFDVEAARKQVSAEVSSGLNRLTESNSIVQSRLLR
jgi:hypothetical protein